MPRNNHKDHSASDLQLAVSLITGEHGLSDANVADAIGVERSNFVQKRSGRVKDYTVFAEDAGRTVEGSYLTKFDRDDMNRLCKFLGELCGYPQGFASPETLVAYAKQHHPEENWQRDHYRTQETKEYLDHHTPRIPEYRIAAQVMLWQAGKKVSELLPGNKQADAVMKKRGNPTAQLKLRELTNVMNALSELQQRETPLTLESMLQEAQQLSPEAFIEVDMPQVQKLMKRTPADRTRTR